MRCAVALAYLGSTRGELPVPSPGGLQAARGKDPKLSANPCMAFWKKLLGGEDERPVDYYHEGTELLASGKFHEALTSFRLALKESPGDGVVLQQIAICYTRIGMVEEAAKTYRHVLQKDPAAPGAHYGLAFILLRGEKPGEAVPHLEAFLGNAPPGDDASAHVEHARWTLTQLRNPPAGTRHEPPRGDDRY